MENLKILFEKAKIKYIVNVDDCYVAASVPEQYEIMKFLCENIDKAIQFFDEIGVDSFAETILALEDERNDYIEALVNDLTEENIHLFIKKYFNYSIEEKKALERFCEELKSNGTIIDYKKIPSIKEATDFFNVLEKNLDVDSDRRVLWMIDKDFQKTNGSSDDGLNLISDFLAKSKPFNIYALTSAQVGDMDNTSFRQRLTNDVSETLLACVIHKHNIIDRKYKDLYKQMYFGFRENYSGIIIDELKSNLSSSALTAGETIKSLGDEAVYKVFLAGSKSEGVAPLETFQRLLLIILKADIAKKLCDNYDKISKLIYDYSTLCSWCSTKEDIEQDFKKVESMRRSECYDDTVNRMFSPVSYGDIFLINETPYLLVAQSCNIVLRKDGYRKAQCATLVQIEMLDKSDESHYLLEYFKPNKKHCVSYNNIINLDFNVLDLCCLNQDGELKLKNDFSLEDVSYRYSDGANIALKSIIDHNRTLIDNYRSLETKRNELSMEELLQKIRTIFKDNSTELSASFEDGVQFNGRRLCRLNQNITDDICKRYAEYHSRKGLDFDFARQYKIHEFDIKYNFDFSILSFDEGTALRQLLNSYKYYQSEDLKNDKLKTEINNDFNIMYNKEFLHNESKNNIGKVDLNGKTITLDSQYIPIKLHNNIICDVLNVKNNILTIKIPKETLNEILVNKSSGTYPEGTTLPQIKISNKHVTFSFGIGQPLIFDNEAYFTRELEFVFTLNDGINLEF